MDYQSLLYSMLFIIVIIVVIKGVGKFILRPKSPVKTIGVRILRKEEGPETDEEGRPLLCIWFHPTVGGEDICVTVKKRVYREMPDSGSGTLTYSGNAFIRFETKGTLIER